MLAPLELLAWLKAENIVKILPVVALAIVSALGNAQQHLPAASTPSSATDQLPAQMRTIADLLNGTWAITWIDTNGHVIGSGEEVWKIAPGGSAFIEENRSNVNGESAEDYAAMWWDRKAHKVHGIWCDPTINDEGCSGFDVTLEGKDVVLSGEWEYQKKRQAWREVFRATKTAMTQTLNVGEPGKELKLASTIRGMIVAGGFGADSNADIAELTRLASDAGHAYAARDLASLERISADDYVQTDVRGRVLNRGQWLDFVKNRRSDLTVESDEVHVRLYGQVAVVTGHWTYTRKEDGQVSYSQWTSVWTRFPEGWKRRAFQNTYVNANADRCATEAVP
jgi:ketosteroid isomerase-like protein